MQQHVEIQHGPAHQYRQPSTAADFFNQPKRIAPEFTGRVNLRGVADIDQVVRHNSAFREQRFGRADIQPAINHRRIDADDFQRQLFRQFDDGRGLAGSRRPHQHQCQGSLRGPAHWPRRNNRSSSAMLILVQVGRP